MPELTERQRTILQLLIRDYIETAQPVGSKRLVERFHLDLSPATVRNEMSALTEMGYLRQPHTSAGRVPSEDGYRAFVGEMIHKAELPASVQNTISHQFFQARPDMDQWMTLAASILANQSQGVSVVTAPHAETIRFKHIELISTQGRQVLMVLVMDGGEVNQQILTLAEIVTQERLSQAAAHLNSLLAGLSMDSIAAVSSRADALEQDIITILLQDMKRTSESVSGEIYTDGLTNVLDEPEFAESDEARWALRLFEERSTLQGLLARASSNSSVGGLQVLIGGSGGWDELRQCSMVVARYGVPGLLTGTLGVLGPMRMSYARTIPTVRYVAGLLSDLVNDTISGE
ncbi:MAG TPA: heat-inducible transcriptional repressor HrcA [Anaerolineales bacterium]|nr:heat-inducible transcriptional repressor HrcA [Anaerolineales bacterium]HMV95113.1 heat-inducible transcriptional repressor HrcA [Anaerolineales bacterium]HMX18300.1 heat-inducible transcriptional repressor HrcA [Anaerolineales bacterium]HMX72803.1 heat-inducible transcriptional repressor HrcA [Anaerolineales bacterium]HMZ41822.1 heat-inducible transcriptional repressor HrcA [Anaerolineales bacterium]